jgi:hypothetical protein
MANNEITCGNSYSTLWHVRAYLDKATPLALSRRRPSCGSLFLLRSIVLTLGRSRRDRHESGERVKKTPTREWAAPHPIRPLPRLLFR